MPATTEVIPNRPLTGPELRKIICDDVDAVLRRDGILQPNVGYHRAAYIVTVAYQLDGPMLSNYRSIVPSRPQPNQHPAIEPGPLKDPSPNMVQGTVSRTRTINNPNRERIQRGMPITVTRRNPNTGMPENKEIKYDRSVLGEGASDVDAGVVDSDIIPNAEWKP